MWFWITMLSLLVAATVFAIVWLSAEYMRISDDIRRQEMRRQLLDEFGR